MNITLKEINEMCDSLGMSLYDFFSSNLFRDNRKVIPFKREYSSKDRLFTKALHDKFEVIGYDHAGDILKNCYKDVYDSLTRVLNDIDITIADVYKKGGNESPIPKKFRELFEKENWSLEQNIKGNLDISIKKDHGIKEKYSVDGFIDGYLIDFFNERIAVDVEWNSKDQTFDRDLSAMRSYYEAGLIAMGIIITRESQLCNFPTHYSFHKKFGASTTWMGQLTDRLEGRRAGGCPILCIGIKREAINGYETDDEYYKRIGDSDD